MSPVVTQFRPCAASLALLGLKADASHNRPARGCVCGDVLASHAAALSSPARPPPMGVPGRPWRVWLCCAGIHVRRVAKDVSSPLGPLTWQPVFLCLVGFLLLPSAAHRCAAITKPKGLLWTIAVDCAKPLDRFRSKPGRPVPGWFPCTPAARPCAAIAGPPGLVRTMLASASAQSWGNHGASKPLPPD